MTSSSTAADSSTAASSATASSSTGSSLAASSTGASSTGASSTAASSTGASSVAASSATGSSAAATSSATASSSTAASSTAAASSTGASSTAGSVEAFASLILAMRTAFTPLSESPRVLHSTASSFLVQSSRGPSPSSIPESFSDSLSASSCFCSTSASAASSSFFFCSSIQALCLLGSDVASSLPRVFLFRAGIVTALGSRVRKRFLMYSMVTWMTLMRNQGVSPRVTSGGLKIIWGQNFASSSFWL